ncbi:glycosyltransferase 87 family protein [Nocardioides sp. C4-1]|uniref:glycosyltransferase 87 family protein n=1 Tax=Nocardioides sp. C4-1 TaxID=3151851 RepID=UPI00326338BA
MSRAPSGPEHVHPTRDDPVVAGLSEVVGGPVGEHAGRGRGVTVLGVLLALTALTFALGLVSKTACAADGWSSTDPSRYTHACVSKVPDAYTGTGLVELAWPWSGDEQTRLRYAPTSEPAAVGLWSYSVARVTHVLSGSPEVSVRYGEPAGVLADSDTVDDERRLFMLLNCLGFAALALAATAALRAARRRRPWDAAGFAVAPVLAVAGVVSWDLLPVAAVAGALWAFSRGRVVLGGALVGAGVAAGVWPVLLLAAFVALCVRDRRPALVLPAVVPAVATWAVLNAPAFLTGRQQWEVFFSTAWQRTPDEGSLWAIVAQSAGLSREVGLPISWALVVLWWAAVLVLVHAAPARPRLSQVALLLVAGVVVLGLTYEPQQALWLLPLAALARPRWRDLLVWQSCELVFFAMTWWWKGGLLSRSDGPAGFYWIAIAVHLVGTLWLVAMVVRDVWWPEDDVVRADERADDASEAPESMPV